MLGAVPQLKFAEFGELPVFGKSFKIGCVGCG